MTFAGDAVLCGSSTSFALVIRPCGASGIIEYDAAATIKLWAFRENGYQAAFRWSRIRRTAEGDKVILGCTVVQNKFEGRVPKRLCAPCAFLGGVEGARDGSARC